MSCACTEMLAVTNAWPPMAAGTGRMMAALLAGQPYTVLAPENSETSELPNVIPLLRHSGKAGGPLKLRTILQHWEVMTAPLSFCGGSAPRLVVCSQPLFSGLGGLKLKRRFGTPLVVFGHGEEFTMASDHSGPLRWRYRLMQKVLAAADLLVFNSENTRCIANERYPGLCANQQVFRPTVDLDELGSVSDEAIGSAKALMSGGPTVLMVGRLSQTHKGFDHTILAMHEVWASVPDAQLIIAGPDDPESLRELAGAAERIKFVGQPSRDELLGLFHECNVFCMPVREVQGASEGFGVVYLEAGFFAKPSVAGKTGGVGEAVLHGETGLQVDGDDPSAIAQAIVTLLRDRDLAQRLGTAAAARVRVEFDRRKASERFRLVIEEFLAGRGG